MRRIAVTLDALQVSAQALEQAVRLAKRMGAELEGIFIEDIDLIEIAALPFVRELRPVSRSENDIDLARMEQELRALARRAERLLSEQAERHNVSWSFRIWRGSIDSDLLAADIGADVLALSRLGAALTRSNAATGRSSAVTVLYSGGDASRRVLDAAIKLAGDPQKELIILFHTDDEAEAGRLQEMATRQLQETAAEAYFIRLTDGALADLIEIMRQTHTAVLVIERDNKLLQTPSLKHCLDSLNCPLLIVR